MRRGRKGKIKTQPEQQGRLSHHAKELEVLEGASEVLKYVEHKMLHGYIECKKQTKQEQGNQGTLRGKSEKQGIILV